MYYVQYSTNGYLDSITSGPAIWSVERENEVDYFFANGDDLIAVHIDNYAICFEDYAHLIDELNLKTGPIVSY
jgi:hypothetical protein